MPARTRACAPGCCAALQVKRLANERLEPGWSFASLYLVKDSLALMMEGAGLALDAYKE